MKRLLFAAVALHKLLHHDSSFNWQVCKESWAIADEMLKWEKPDTTEEEPHS